MDFVNAIFNTINDFTWGWWLIPLLIVIGCFFTFASGFVQLQFFGRMFRVLFPGGQA
jgi:AGCS family alanine or glycine:cation symporter